MPRVSTSYRAKDTLPDGRVIVLRAIRPEDRERLREEFLKLSKASVRDRFFSVKLDLTPAELTYFTEVDFSQHVALVAELETSRGQRPVGVGRFVRLADQPDHAEIALTVADEMHGRGIGRVLLQHLIDGARELGIHHLDATVFAENTRMSNMLRKTGLPLESQLEDGVRTLTLTL